MLTLNNLKKSYDQTSILNGISLSIETGKSFPFWDRAEAEKQPC